MRRLLEILLLTACMAIHAQGPVILDTDPGYDPDDMGCMADIGTLFSGSKIFFWKQTVH